MVVLSGRYTLMGFGLGLTFTTDWVSVGKKWPVAAVSAAGFSWASKDFVIADAVSCCTGDKLAGGLNSVAGKTVFFTSTFNELSFRPFQGTKHL